VSLSLHPKIGLARASLWLCAALIVSVVSACGDDSGKPDQDPDPGAETDRDATTGGKDGGMDGGREPEPRIDAALMIDATVVTSDGAVELPDATTPADAQVLPDAGDAGDPNADLFAEDKLLEVKLTLAPEDWDKLRAEGRNLNDVFSGCSSETFDYTKFHASVTVAGQALADVGVRKKGFLGSISVRKPSLRLELDEYVDKQTLLGTKTLVLNNNHTDSSFTHTCMAYAAYRRAGIAAPRCSWARVTVNDQLLGIYNNVEPIKKPFLKRVFGNDEGNLYEGQAPADFRTDLLKFFEKKTHEDDVAKPELEALSLLLTKSDAELLAGIDALVDLEHFYRFWATETLVANWDGYSSNNNNFYVYADADSKKLKFLPWGPDDSFDRDPVLLARPEGTAQSVYATARLSRRLYAIESTRERYRQALRNELTMHWDEAALLAEIDRIAALVGTANAATLDKQRDFVRTRRAQLEAELAVAAPVWPFPEKQPGVCSPERVVPLSGSFRATWESLSAPAPALENALSIIGMPQLGLAVAAAGASAEPQTLQNSTVALTIVRPDSSLLVIQYQVGARPLSVGSVSMHGFETFGAALSGPDAAGLKLFGLVGEGKITFTEASSTTGMPIAGTFTGKLVALAPLPLYPPLSMAMP
jgi:spore coat protein H